MIRRTLSLTPLVLIAALVAPMTATQLPVGASLSAQDAATFAGSWILNPDKSDNPREVMQRSRQGTGSNFAERGRRPLDGNRAPRVGGNGGGAPTAQQRAANRVMMEIGMWRAPAFEISETDKGFRITLPDGMVLTLQTDKEERTSAQGGIEIKTKAEAKKDEIKVQYKGPGNAKVERKFKLKDDGATLLVETSITNSRMEINFKFKQSYLRSD
jgi:hypothetical protein